MSPRLPLSRPAMTTTLSPFLILRMGSLPSLQDFRRERHDLHEPLVAQLARDGSEDARADRLELGGEQHGGVGIEADQRAVRATHALARAHDDRVVDLALLDTPARSRVLHRDLDHVTDVRVAALAAAQHLDTHHRTCACVIGDVQHRLHLDHCSTLQLNPPSAMKRRLLPVLRNLRWRPVLDPASAHPLECAWGWTVAGGLVLQGACPQRTKTEIMAGFPCLRNR